MVHCNPTSPCNKCPTLQTCTCHNCWCWRNWCTCSHLTFEIPHRLPKNEMIKTLQTLFSIFHINIEPLLNFDFYFWLWVFVCKLASHVHVNVDRDFCNELHSRHRLVVSLDLNLVTSSQGCLEHLSCRDACDWTLIILQFFPSCKFYVDVANNWKKTLSKLVILINHTFFHIQCCISVNHFNLWVQRIQRVVSNPASFLEIILCIVETFKKLFVKPKSKGRTDN